MCSQNKFLIRATCYFFSYACDVLERSLRTAKLLLLKDVSWFAFQTLVYLTLLILLTEVGFCAWNKTARSISFIKRHKMQQFLLTIITSHTVSLSMFKPIDFLKNLVMSLCALTRCDVHQKKLLHFHIVKGKLTKPKAGWGTETIQKSYQSLKERHLWPPSRHFTPSLSNSHPWW